MNHDDEIARRAMRLKRVSRLIAARAANPPSGDFDEDADGCNPLPWEFPSDLEAVLPCGGDHVPTNRRGIFFWRTEPLKLGSLRQLCVAVSTAALRGCFNDTFVLRHRLRQRAVIFDFMIGGTQHAHVGRVIFFGSEVERLLDAHRAYQAAWQAAEEERLRRKGTTGGS